MTTDTMQDTARLHQLLTDALALADTLGYSMTAIHIAEALDQVVLPVSAAR
jgi:hypothetical protein